MITIEEFISKQKEFDDKHHTSFDWSTKITSQNVHVLEYLLLATVGELGETANILKKILRGDMSFEDAKQDLTNEIVDIFIYVIKLIYQMDIDIGTEYQKKMKINAERFEKYKK
jgi:NTP pyrophosphatase (non-canonical NTP hydrolase)